MAKQFYVYILASRKYGALYTGVTSDLPGRVYMHRNQIVDGHTANYQIHTLVYFEVYEDAAEAILREKRIKKWMRSWKIELIEKSNPDWADLYPQIAGR